MKFIIFIVELFFLCDCVQKNKTSPKKSDQRMKYDNNRKMIRKLCGLSKIEVSFFFPSIQNENKNPKKQKIIKNVLRKVPRLWSRIPTRNRKILWRMWC